ncbi:S1-like domain-containing RNA-binding protein [uncultured Croceitalea sp.]|uniref:CvfB family protein n=1 Tax=uncultured Croceitalea sp. TaxID=1798908 RepID=UPI003305CCE7
MIQLGNYNTLEILRSTSVGLFLGDDEGTEILLPNKYVPDPIEIGQKLKVFCYLDNSERPVSTILEPYIIRNEFAFLEVAEISAYGAFMDWGLEKHLLVPFREQRLKMEKGRKYVVHCYLDEQSFRLTASNKLDKFLDNEKITKNLNDEVSLLISRKTELGWEAVVDNKHKGLLFFSDVFKEIRIGDRLTGFIKNIREDKKLDVSLLPIGQKMLEPTSELILKKIKEAGGFLTLHDKSSPEEIKEELQLSKKAFKKGVGVLYRERKIAIEANGIRLL